MRLYEGMIPTISSEIAKHLAHTEELLEVEPGNLSELELDIQAVLNEYVRMERELYNRARDINSSQSGSHSNVYKIKKRLAREKDFKLGDESLEYMVKQLIETFFHSMYVEDIFATDNELRRAITPILKKHMGKDDELDEEVRSKIKNLEEGTRSWEIEYEKVMERMKRIQNLE